MNKTPGRFFSIILLLFLGTTIAQAAVLDNLFENLNHKTPQKKHHRHHRYHHTISDEAKWQTSLKFLGYYDGKIDGDLMTEESFDAIEEFQKKREIVANGFLEEKYKNFLSSVYEAIAMKNYLDYSGKKRINKKKTIQAALFVEGVYSGKIDGRIGKKSKKSILAYKEKMDLNSTKRPVLSSEEKIELIDDAKLLAQKKLDAFRVDDQAVRERYLKRKNPDNADLEKSDNSLENL